MKKKFLVGLTTGILTVALVGLSHAAPDIGNDVYADNNSTVGSEFGTHEMRADMKTLRKLLRDKALRDKALKAIPAAGPQQNKGRVALSQQK